MPLEKNSDLTDLTDMTAAVHLRSFVVIPFLV